MSNKEPEYIVIGTILSPWGLQGHMKVDVETDFPERFSPSSKVFIDKQPVIINEVAWHKGKAIIKLEGLDTGEEVDALVGRVIEVHYSQLYSLEDGEYYHFQLVGLEVKTTGGEVLGNIDKVLSMASADIYVIKGRNGDILIPATDEFVKSIDLAEGVLVIELMDGLLDLNRKKTR